MVEKEKDSQKPINEHINIDNDLINPNIKNIIYKNNNGNKSSTNLKTSLNSTIKKNDKKELFINTDFKTNLKNKQNIIINSENIENVNNKITTNNDNPKKEKEEDFIIDNNNKNELTTNLNYKNNIS